MFLDIARRDSLSFVNNTMEKLAGKTGFYNHALEAIWLAAVFLIPLFFNPLSHQAFYLNKTLLLQLLVFVMLAFTVAKWVYGSPGLQSLSWRQIKESPLRLAIIIFGLLAALSTATSIMPSLSFWGSWNRSAGLLTLICWILFCLIVAQNLRRREQINRIIYTLLLSSAIVALLGILQSYFPQEMQNFFHTAISNRVASTTGNSLSLSAFLAMVIPLNMAFIVNLWNNRKEGKNGIILVALCLLLVLQFWCLWLAQYAVTMLLFLVSSVLFITLLGIVKKNRYIIGAGAVFVLTLIIIAVSIVSPMLLSNGGAAKLEYKDLSTVLSQEELLGISLGTHRVEYWKSAVDIVIQTPEVALLDDSINPLRSLIGYGPETFNITFQSAFPEELKSSYTHYSELVDRPHNHYLYLATTGGILGLAAFIAILAAFFFLSWKQLKKAGLEADKLLLIAFVAAMLQYMADSLFNPSTISAELIFWLLLALTMVMGKFLLNDKPPLDKAVKAPGKIREIIPTSPLARNIVSTACAVLLIAGGAGITYKPFKADIRLQEALNMQAEMDPNTVYAYSRVIGIQPEQAAYWGYLAGYRYIIAINSSSKDARTTILEASIEDYEKARQLEPYIAYRYYVLADVYAYMAQDGDGDKWQPAFSLYQQALQLFPGNAVIMNKWALALIMKGDYEGGRLKLEQAASLDPDWVETAFLQALLPAMEGNDNAAVELKALVEEDPVNLWYFRELCSQLIIYNMLQPLDAALENYTETADNEWVADAMLGVTNFYSGDGVGSLEKFDTAMSLVPDKYTRVLFTTTLDLAKLSPGFRDQLAENRSSVAG